MAGGREFHGQPKRIAEISVQAIGDLHIGRVRHNGIDIFTGTMQYKASPSSPDRLRSRVDLITNINFKVINHIDGRPAIKQLTARDLTDLTVHECWEGPCPAEIRPSATAPLYRLPALAFLEGFYWLTDFWLIGGTILHDYHGGGPAAAKTLPNGRWFHAPSYHPSRGRRPVRPGRKNRGMLIALAAVLGVDLVTLAFVVAILLSRRAWVSDQRGAFKGMIRVVDGEVPGLRRKWKRGFGRWVGNVLVWAKAPSLFRNELVQADLEGAGARGAR